MSINHMQFDMLGSPIYAAVAKEITALLTSKAIDPHDINEIMYISGMSFFFFFKFLFNLNMFSFKQEKMGLASVCFIMYEYSVLIDES